MNEGKRRHFFESELSGQEVAEVTKPQCLEKQRCLPMFGTKQKLLNHFAKMASRHSASNLTGSSGKD